MIRVICYDIKDDKRRYKLFKLLKDYGQWIQYSVFEVDCNEQEWLLLDHRMKRLLSGEDSLCMYHMCRTCTKKVHYDQKLAVKLEKEKNNIL